MSLSPDQFRKVNKIKAALDKSDRAVKYHFISLNTFERLPRNRRVEGFRQVGPKRSRSSETNYKKRRPGPVLGTGLRAERLLRDGLKESAAAVEAWRYGLTSNSVREIDAATSRMQRTRAQQTGSAKQGWPI